MERKRARYSMHERLLSAVERATQVQEESCVLIEHQHAVTTALHETVERIEQRRTAIHGARRHAAREPS